MKQAYVLFEVDPAVPDAQERLRTVSLGSCKLLVASLVPNEVLGHLHCENGPVMHDALGELASVEGVRRLTVFRITSTP
ncbi:hypothetical protein [Streptomyces sp. NPDC018693]|uniref:hypothetical protein n=1 Tax=unclassified Streptomyces TaxID=2593676 RepID=UPI0037AB6A3D